MVSPIIYFNIGWMAAYAGHSNDPISGGHQFLADHAFGGEAFNFLPDADGLVRGCRPGSTKGLRIERLGAGDKTVSYVDGVTVIWMAREPKGGRTLIVGWYRNARVYRDAEPAPYPRLMPNGEAIPVTAETQAKDAVLLPPAARTFRIESRRTADVGFGQSPAWYGGFQVDDLVRAYIDSAEQRITKSKAKRRGKGKGGRRQSDPELRKAVEEAAIEHAGIYFQSDVGGACEVVSVEREAKGWDLEASGVEGTWLVEVKGLSGSRLSCEVTPNEFAAMNSAHRGRYVLYVVCNALDAPIASIFRWQGNAWRTEDGRVLEVSTRTGAVLTCD